MCVCARAHGLKFPDIMSNSLEKSSLKIWKEIGKSRPSLKYDQQKMYLLMKKNLFGKIFKKIAELLREKFTGPCL